MAVSGFKNMNGWLIVDKPKGWTSFDVVAKIRGITKERKVGHTGTLDPQATGVLIIALGKATKLIQFIAQTDKEYLATIRLGITTDTFDSEGKILKTKEAPQLSRNKIEEVLSQFRGEIEQLPPMFSAIKSQGKKLYQLARKGITVERKSRKVKIKKLQIENIDLPFLTLRIECSKGTYIRSLANDLGEKLGCGAYLHQLVRLRAGQFRLEQAVKMEQLNSLEEIQRYLLPLENSKNAGDAGSLRSE
ncbi:MAG: tRNA pseudouridine(55) synthase TruB [Candidatus Edwardsbacteria bacterium]